MGGIIPKSVETSKTVKVIKRKFEPEDEGSKTDSIRKRKKGNVQGLI